MVIYHGAVVCCVLVPHNSTTTINICCHHCSFNFSHHFFFLHETPTVQDPHPLHPRRLSPLIRGGHRRRQRTFSMCCPSVQPSSQIFVFGTFTTCRCFHSSITTGMSYIARRLHLCTSSNLDLIARAKKTHECRRRSLGPIVVTQRAAAVGDALAFWQACTMILFMATGTLLNFFVTGKFYR